MENILFLCDLQLVFELVIFYTHTVFYRFLEKLKSISEKMRKKTAGVKLVTTVRLYFIHFLPF